MVGHQRPIVEPVGQDRLRVHRRLQIPAVVVVGVERVEPHVARFGPNARPLRDRPQRHPGPRRHRRPALDTVVLDRIRQPAQRLDLLARQLQLAPHQAAHPQAPAARLRRCRRHPADVVGGERSRPLVLRVLGRRRVGIEQPLAQPVVEAAHPEQCRLDRVAPVPAAGGAGRRGGAGGQKRSTTQLTAHRSHISLGSERPVIIARSDAGSATNTRITCMIVNATNSQTAMKCQ